MSPTWSRFNIVSVVLGFAFLYLPIVLLVIFSSTRRGSSPSGAASRPSGTAHFSVTRASWTPPG
jgi:ABC-type spermidine/putrescine transport system permease subunit II